VQTRITEDRLVVCCCLHRYHRPCSDPGLSIGARVMRSVARTRVSSPPARESFVTLSGHLLGIPGTVRERHIRRRPCLCSGPGGLSWGLSSYRYGPHADVSVVALFAALPAKMHSGKRPRTVIPIATDQRVRFEVRQCTIGHGRLAAESGSYKSQERRLRRRAPNSL
jgi:hypothetical protein